MSNFTVIYDSCVLYPAPLRDFLMQLAITDLFMAKWTDKIHSEWMGNLLRNRPDLTLEQLTRTKNLMNNHVRDCLVTGYEALITSLQLPDPDDRHVLAAAIFCNASVIVTFNLRDFPVEALSLYSIEPQHPDDFILHLININPIEIGQVVKRHINRLKNPPKTPDEYFKVLQKQQLVKSVTVLRNLCHDI